MHYQKDPVFTTRTSVIGILNMLELAKQNSCPILQASTSEVYGDAEQHPQKEGYHGNVNPIGIRSCYDEGKRCAESLCMDYHREFGVKVKIVRDYCYAGNVDKTCVYSLSSSGVSQTIVLGTCHAHYRQNGTQIETYYSCDK